MKYSICIPSYNKVSYITRAVESALGQLTLPDDVEIIVVDNGSTDGTVSQLEYLRDKHGHPTLKLMFFGDTIPLVDNWNRCLSLTRGRYVCLLHADDWLHPRFLSTLGPILDDHPTVDLATCLTFKVDERTGRCVSQFTRFPEPGMVANPYHYMIRHGCIAPPSVLLRRSSLDRIGLFDPALPTRPDRDLWLRFAKEGIIYSHPEHLSFYRYGDNNGGLQNARGTVDCIDEEIRLIEKHRRLYRLSGSETRDFREALVAGTSLSAAVHLSQGYRAIAQRYLTHMWAVLPQECRRVPAYAASVLLYASRLPKGAICLAFNVARLLRRLVQITPRTPSRRTD